MALQGGERSLPTEILQKIFISVDPKTIPKCRLINRQCRDIIDNLINTDDSMWADYCKKIFPNQFMGARDKCLEEMSNFDLFRSLTLWSQLGNLKIDIKCEDLGTPMCLKGLQVIKNGRIGIHTKYSILYFNYINKVVESTLNGSYSKYAENKELIVILSMANHLLVNWKVLYHENQKPRAAIPGVLDFLLDNHRIYFVSRCNKVYKLVFYEENIEIFPLFLPPSAMKFWAIEEDTLSLVTVNNELLCYKDGNLQYCSENSIDLYTSMRYGFFKRTMFHKNHLWFDYLNQFQGVTCIVPYGQLLFLGSEWGFIAICHLKNADPLRPIKTINLVESNQVSAHDHAILSITILEEIASHRLFIVTPKKLYTVIITHE